MWLEFRRVLFRSELFDQVMPYVFCWHPSSAAGEWWSRADDGCQHKTYGITWSKSSVPTAQTTCPTLASHFPDTSGWKSSQLRIRGHDTEGNSKFILYQLGANSLLFVQKLNLWKSICGGYSPVTLLKVVNQTHWILGNKENLNVIRAPHFTYEEIKDRRRNKRKLT